MGDGSGGSGISRDSLLGKLALERGWITPEQLRKALAQRWTETGSGDGRNRGLGAILIASGLLTPARLEELKRDLSSAVPAFPPFGKYTLLRELGRGAMGVVYEAEDSDLHRKVALKMLIGGAEQDSAESRPEQERFLREAELTRSLSPHPGIVPVLEAGIIDDRRYLAMERVAGLSLSAWRKQGSVTIRQQIVVLRDVAMAVHHAHEHGIIHRDLKPENVLIDSENRPHVTDFGLAKNVGSRAPLETATGAALGTPAYMSPEQVKGAKDIDRRTDIYSLGVMLYEILTGRRPFSADSPYELMMKTVNEPVVPPSRITNIQINPLLYRNIENICLIALAKEPGGRYPTAASFAADLTAWLKGDDGKAVVPQRWRVWRAKQVVMRGVVVLALLAVAGASFFSMKQVKEKAVTVIAPAPVEVEGLQPGAMVECFAGQQFNSLGLSKIDTRTSFDDLAQPVWRESPQAWVSHRWSGYLRVHSTGTYLFDVRSPAFARLLIGGVEMRATPQPSLIPIKLREGVHRILIEQAQQSRTDRMSIFWKKDGETSAVALGPGSLLHSLAGFKPVEPQPLRSLLGPVPGAQEAETLEVLDHSGQPPLKRSFGGFSMFWKGSWSGDGYLWWGQRLKVGDRLKLRFSAGETEKATVALGVTYAGDSGIYKVSVNGTPIAGALDLFGPALTAGELEFQNVEVKAGANELEFQVVGTNPSAREWGPGSGLYKLGFDYVLVH